MTGQNSSLEAEIVLEALPGYAVPVGCYAALRCSQPGGAVAQKTDGCSIPSHPVKCMPQLSTSIGTIKQACGGEVSAASPGAPYVIDIFQHVGSITLEQVELGSTADGVMYWPGSVEVKLRVTVAKKPQVVPTPDTSVATPLPKEAVQASERRGSMTRTPSRGERSATPKQDRPSKPHAHRGHTVCFSAEGAVELGDTLETLKETEKVGKHRERAKERLSLAATKVLEQVREDHSKLFKTVVLENCDMIIPNLFLGGIVAAMDTQRVVDQGIRAVVCCCRCTEFPERDFHKDLNYYRVDVEDIAREPIELFFPEATAFIHSWFSRDAPVLVHCRAGVSRSASVVLAYLVEYHKYSLHDAFFLARSHRSVITPNVGFMEKLMDYEEAKRGTEPSIDINKYQSWYTSSEQAAVPDLRPD
mmetsp:Transcript_35533/g.81392  ORF Transcript_35533/g.81392 Transcript_35533/m.81392 type:complete len:417 (+) Transcript_35533:81-1331(+)